MMREEPLSARGPLAHPAARRTREVRGGEVPKLRTPRAAPWAPAGTSIGYAYRTTALGAQRVHGQGVRGKEGVAGAPPLTKPHSARHTLDASWQICPASRPATIDTGR